MKKMISSMASELIILFVPQLLSPLHLASYYSYQKNTERQKKLNKLSKKMLLIADDHQKIEEKQLGSLENMNYVELFHRVYRQIEYLNLKELKILRNFCCALYNPYDLTINRNHEIETEEEIYYKYKNILNNVVEQKTKKKIFSKT